MTALSETTPAGLKHARTLPLSVTIVCCNNEATIERTVLSVKDLAAEIIALDSGSTDRTKEILSRHGVRVIDQPWLGHVKQKQAAMDLAMQPWVLHMDSDESLEPELRESVRAAIEKDDPAVAGYEMNRRVWWDGQFLNYAWQPEWRLRLVRRGCARWTGYDPHDRLEIEATKRSPGTSDEATKRRGDEGAGNQTGRRSDPPEQATEGDRGRVERLRGVMRHDTIPSFDEFMKRQVSHARIAAESYVRMGRRGSVIKIITSPTGAFLKQMVLKQAWRDGWKGWAAAGATAAGAYMKQVFVLGEERRSDEATERRRGKNS